MGRTVPGIFSTTGIHWCHFGLTSIKEYNVSLLEYLICSSLRSGMCSSVQSARGLQIPWCRRNSDNVSCRRSSGESNSRMLVHPEHYCLSPQPPPPSPRPDKYCTLNTAKPWSILTEFIHVNIHPAEVIAWSQFRTSATCTALVDVWTGRAELDYLSHIRSQC